MKENIVRKTLYTAVGLVAGTTERLQYVIDEMVSKGKISAEDGKKVVDDVVKTTDHRRDEYENKFRNLIDAVLSKLNLPQGDAYEKLEKRIKSLEVKLGLLAKELESQRKAAVTADSNEETTAKKSSRKTKSRSRSIPILHCRHKRPSRKSKNTIPKRNWRSTNCKI
jgi:polyhydroxyalkanoate synthesis regulator phasin